MNEKLDYSTGLLLAFFTLMILLVILLLIPSIGHAQAGDPYPAPIITVVPYPAPIITAIPYPTLVYVASAPIIRNYGAIRTPRLRLHRWFHGRFNSAVV